MFHRSSLASNNVRLPSLPRSHIDPQAQRLFGHAPPYPISAWTIGHYEDQSPTSAQDFNSLAVTDDNAWSSVQEIRVGDLALAERFWHENEEYRRVSHARYLAIRSSDAYRSFGNPRQLVQPDRPFTYLKKLPHGARFQVQEGSRHRLTKLETDHVRRCILASDSHGRLHVFSQGNTVVLFDREPSDR